VLAVEHVGQRHVLALDRGGEDFGDGLTQGERLAQNPAGVLDRLLGLDRAVRHDLADPVVAVLLADVADHLAAATLVEVDVEVGHGRAFGVEEALEDQAVRDRVEVGDPHRVGAHRTGTRPASRTDADAVVLGPVDEVRHDQEVAGVALVDDHLLLEGGLFPGVVRHAAGEAGLQSPVHLAHEPGRLRLPGGHVEARHEGAHPLVEGGGAALGDQQRVVAGLGNLGEQPPHLGRRLEVVAVAVELEPVRGVPVGSRRHAQEHVVGLGVLGVDVVQVVGGHQRQGQVLGQTEQVAADPGLDVQAVVHQFDEIVAGAEDVAEFGRRGAGLFVLPQPEVGLHLTRRAPGGRDAAGGVALQQFPVGSRFVEEPFQRRQRTQPEQVVHPGVVLRPDGEVGVGALGRDVVAGAVAELHAFALAAVGLGGEVGLQTDDRLDRGALRRFVELVGAEQVAVVGDRQGRHPHPFGPGEQVAQPGGAVQHRILGMAVQMYEPIRHGVLDLQVPRTSAPTAGGSQRRGPP